MRRPQPSNDAVIEEIRKRARGLLMSLLVLAMPALSPAEEAVATAKVKAPLKNLRRKTEPPNGWMRP